MKPVASSLLYAALMLFVTDARLMRRPLQDPAPGPAVSPSGDYVCMPGGDFMGDEVEASVEPVKDQASCEALCSSTAACWYYVFLLDGRCVLKTNLLNGTKSSTRVDPDVMVAGCVNRRVVDVVSMGKACVAGFDFAGTNLNTTTASSAEECFAKCTDIPSGSFVSDCTFSVYATDGFCMLRNHFLTGSDGKNEARADYNETCLRIRNITLDVNIPLAMPNVGQTLAPTTECDYIRDYELQGGDMTEAINGAMTFEVSAEACCQRCLDLSPTCGGFTYQTNTTCTVKSPWGWTAEPREKEAYPKPGYISGVTK